VPQRSGQHDLHRAIARVDGDRVVPERGAGLAVGFEKRPRRIPALPPLLLGELGVGEVVPGLTQPPAAHHDRRVPGLDARLGPREPGPERLQAALLAEPLALAGVAAYLALPLPARHRQTTADDADRAAQAGPLGVQAAQGQLILILARPGHRPRPARG
jgi:hypothetical protein